ncbi:MAG TPA: adenylyl-sulfate kinase [Planctomycetota bacterium]|nr:adenylyl-sulfate kinase [Planctomycetota bacterium]
MIEPFAVWLTGVPASGKSTLARALADEFQARGIRPAILESDALRAVLTPHPRFDEEEREVFYGALLHIGTLLVDHGVPVLFDATANLRRYRDRARERIPRFFEVFVHCPIDVCRARDPKGLYRRAAEGAIGSLPGAGGVYEPPLHPEFLVRSDRESPPEAARRLAGAILTEVREPASPRAPTSSAG